MRSKTISVSGGEGDRGLLDTLDQEVQRYLASVGSPRANRVQTSLAQSLDNETFGGPRLVLTMNILVFDLP